MNIPIKQMLLEMSTALKRREAFQRAGIIPIKNDPNKLFPQKFAYRNIVDSKGRLLPKENLNYALYNMGKMDNNNYQVTKKVNKIYGNPKEIMRTYEKGYDSGWVGGTNNDVSLPDEALKRKFTLHTHPERSISDKINNLYVDKQTYHLPSGYDDKRTIPNTDMNTFKNDWSNKGNSLHRIVVPTEDIASALFINNENKKAKIIPFNMSKYRNRFDLDGNLLNG